MLEYWLISQGSKGKELTLFTLTAWSVIAFSRISPYNKAQISFTKGTQIPRVKHRKEHNTKTYHSEPFDEPMFYIQA
jgi:hypothetical protein